MNAQRFFSSVLSISGMLLCLSSGGLLNPGEAIAQSRRVQLNLPNLSAPGNRESGSTRSESCVPETDRLQALMPLSNYGQTATGYPTFFFYMPETTAEVAQFVIYDEASLDLVYEGTFAIAGESGIVSIALPNNGLQKALTEGDSYYWYFSLLCDAEDPSASIVVGGTVARVEPSTELAAALVETSLETRTALYAEAGLWHDALTASAQLGSTGNDETWTALLEAVELDDLAAVPLLADALLPSAEE
jgi:hypothetical protein